MCASPGVRPCCASGIVAIYRRSTTCAAWQPVTGTPVGCRDQIVHAGFASSRLDSVAKAPADVKIKPGAGAIHGGGTSSHPPCSSTWEVVHSGNGPHPHPVCHQHLAHSRNARHPVGITQAALPQRGCRALVCLHAGSAGVARPTPSAPNLKCTRCRGACFTCVGGTGSAAQRSAVTATACDQSGSVSRGQSVRRQRRRCPPYVPAHPRSTLPYRRPQPGPA